MPNFISSVTKDTLRNVQRVEPSACLAARKAWSLTGCGYAGEPRLKIVKQQIRWSFAAALHGKAALEWFNILQTPEMSLFATLNPRLALKPFRVYISNKWGIERKIKVITDTYTFIRACSSPLQDALVRPEGINLAQLTLAHDSDVRVILRYENTYRKEGELVVSLWTPATGFIISLAFSFEQMHGGEWAMYIGCIQGRTGIDNKPISKAMHGLWPRVFIVFAIQEIARAVGVHRIFGVGNAIHSYRNKHIIHIPSRHAVTFDYDSLWTEVDGSISEEGWFDIPLQLQRRPYDDMKSNKRAMYNRRYGMLDDISTQIQSALSPDRHPTQ